MYVNREVDAVAHYVAGLRYPRLRAIQWNEQRIELDCCLSVDRVTCGLLYRVNCVDGVAERLTVRFEPERHRWVLESVLPPDGEPSQLPPLNGSLIDSGS